jgi:hypothetical protein
MIVLAKDRLGVPGVVAVVFREEDRCIFINTSKLNFLKIGVILVIIRLKLFSYSRTWHSCTTDPTCGRKHRYSGPSIQLAW